MDNILTVFEILHSFKNRRVGKISSFSFNLDISKAYDRGEWRFIEVVLGKMDFSKDWITRLMRFFSSVSYSAVINGKVKKHFLPIRGI